MRHRALIVLPVVMLLTLFLPACTPPTDNGGDNSGNGSEDPKTDPNKIIPTSPLDGSVTLEATPRLIWGQVGVNEYDLQYGVSEAAAIASTPIALTDCQYLLPAALAVNDVVYWRVRTRSGPDVVGAWSDVFSFSITDTPVLVSALADGGTVDSQVPLLDWDDPTGSLSHQVQVATDSAFTNITEENLTLAGSQYQLTTSIPLGSTRYWRIRCGISTGLSQWSTSRSFKVAWTPTYTVRTPANASTTFDRTPGLYWGTAVTGASSYQVQTGTSEAEMEKSSPIPIGSGTAYTCPTTTFGTTIYWRVRPVNSESAAGPWSTAQSFTVTSTYAPTAAAVNTADTTPTLSWTSAGAGVSYEIELDTTSTFDGVGIVSAANCSYTSPTIPAGSYRWWRVRALNDTAEYSSWTTFASFRIDWNYAITAANPVDASTTLDQTALLDWSDVAGATSYKVAFAATTILLVSAKLTPHVVSSSEYQILAADIVSFGASRVWAVQPVNSEGFGSGTWTPFSFAVSNTVTWVVTKPTDGGVATENPPYIQWNGVTGAVSYDFQLATSSAGVSAATPVSCPSYIYFDNKTVPDGSWRYWRVRAKNDNANTTAYSSIYSFSYGWSYTVNPTFPLDGATNTGTDLTPTLTWSAVAGAASYEIQVNQNSAPTGSTGIACATNSFTTPALGNGTLWYWRVRPINSEGFAGSWTKAWSFTAK
jgi:hypothetical protein